MKTHSLHPDLRNFLWKVGIDVPVMGDVNFVLKNGTKSKAYWQDKVPAAQQQATIALANDALGDLRDDVVIVTPESHSLAAALTISKNQTHWVGSGLGKFAMRSRIGMSTTFTPMITVSGYGNSFHNLYTMHGTAVGDYAGWLVSGDRNSFFNCHFAGPMNAAQGGGSSYTGFNITGSENHFQGCVFGSASIGRDEATPNLTITQSGGEMLINTFKDCIFVLMASDTDPYFIHTTCADGLVLSIFDNCQFICVSSNNSVKAAVAVTADGAAYASTYTVFSPTCQFTNVSHIVAAAQTATVHMPTVFAATADELNLIAINSATY